MNYQHNYLFEQMNNNFIIKRNINMLYFFIKLYPFISFYIITDNYMHIYVKNNNMLLSLITFLKKSSFFSIKTLIDIKCEDISLLSYSNNYRFKVTYIFLNYKSNNRIFLTVFLNTYGFLPSVTFLFPSANFLERELWDQFGLLIGLQGNLVNRRLFTDYGFKGHPLKKDYPLTGFVECFYCYEKKRIIIKPLCLLQENRKFSFKPYYLG